MKKNVIKKMLSAALISVLSLSLLTGCGAGKAATPSSDSPSSEVEETESAEDTEKTSADGEKVIRVANFGTAIWNDQFLVAYQNGIYDEIFKDDNVKIEVINFENGPAANEAFIAGEIDIVNGIGDQPIVIGMGNNVETTILTGTAKQAQNIGIVVKKDSGIEKVEDLKGKKVGVFFGTYVHKSLIGLLSDAGITEDDVEIVNITSTSDADAAFESGDIDAYLSMSAYHIYTNVESGNYVKIADCSNHPAFAYIVAANKFIEENPDLVEKFLEGLYKAEQWINENKEESYKVISEFSGLEVDQVKHTIEDADCTIIWDDAYESNLQATYDFLKAHDMITNDLTNEQILDHVDTSFVKKVTGK
ncbi:MAG: ABC transporter substrate-binding protein [Lachnospiraceae bacterium]|nr:ABC transporter substrate-binding protein [Lachnospiraceae bacterium]